MGVSLSDRIEAEVLTSSADGSEHTPCRDPLSRWVLAGIGAGYLVTTFAQASGLIESDTKLPLILTPVAYMESAVHLWSDQVFGGAVTQSVDLVMPMGPFFALAQLLHVPTWCAERIWLALLLTVGCWGVIRLAEALGIGKRYARVLAGIAYCAAPIVLTWTTTTAALLAVVLLPWVVQPLVVGSRYGSTRRAAAFSGLAVALMGGPNATVILAVLPVPALWLLTRTPGPRRRSLICWWVVAMGLACFWWAISLVLAGRYGYNYLPYTETAVDTTSTASAFEALRGASFWTDYDTLGGALLPGAWMVVSSAAVIIGTTTVTALGLAGLCRRIPERLFLVSSLAVGVVAIAAGYSGASGGPFSHALQQLLDAGLAPFRSVSKFSPDVALPLALGLASIISLEPVREAGRTRPPRETSALVVGIKVVAVVALVLATAPFWRLDLYGSGGFSSIPGYWTQAGRWLDAHQGHENTLLVPGADSGDYTWGAPLDEPLSVVSHTPLLWRDVVPYGSNGSTQMLSAVEQALDGGTVPPGFAQFLSREGVEYVVERNDLDSAKTGVPLPAQVHQVLSETQGLTEVASFGPVIPEQQVQAGTLPVYDSRADSRLRSVEIFRVDPSTSEVHTYPVSDPVVVSGDAGSLLQLAGADVLNGRATVLAGDPLARRAAGAPRTSWAITDGNQRRDVSFGGIRNNTSYLLGANQTLSSKPAGIPLTYTVVPGSQHQTVEAPIGAASASASSFGPSSLYDDPTAGPYSAFDGNPGTAWVANAEDDSVGQWISISFDRSIRLSTIMISQLAGFPQQPTIRQVTISTDRGSVIRSLPDSASPVRLTLPPGASRHLKVTIDAVRPAPQASVNGIAAGAGISEIKIPGVSFQQNMRLPNDEAAAFSAPDRNPPVVVVNRTVPNANLSLNTNVTDDTDMARTFNLPKPMAATITGYAVPLPGPQLESLINFVTPVTSATEQITASSWLADLPRFRPENLLESSGSPWIAGFGDPQPSISLSWSGARSIGSIALALTPRASRPTEIRISSPAGSRLLSVPRNGGLISFAPLVTSTLTIDLLKVAPKSTLSPAYNSPVTLPVGLASVRIPTLRPGTSAASDPSRTVALGCGQGPPVVVDGASTPTSVSASLADLIDLRPVQIAACTTPRVLNLAAGHHSVEAPSTSAPFEITSLALQNPLSSLASEAGLSARTATVEHWDTATRSIRVGSGPATYLVIPENYNAAWVATLGGRTLAPVRIDGWQQGYVVPAGSAGTVQLTMAPDTLFRVGLLLGAILLLALLFLAVVPDRRPARDPAGPRRPPIFWPLAAGAVLALTLVGGPLGLLAIPLLLAARRWGGGLMAIVAFVAFLGAGVAVAWHAGALPTTHTGAFGRTAQIASVVAFGAALSAAAVEGRPWRRRPVADDPVAPGLAPEIGNDTNTAIAQASLEGAP